MNTYAILESIKYKGGGHALAAIVNKTVVWLIYVSDIIPEFNPEKFDFELMLNDCRLSEKVRELSAFGRVSFGMCSCGEFVEL